MREFQIEAGGGWNKWDTKTGKCPAVWELNDVQSAMEAHARRFSTKLTLSIFRDITGVDAEKTTIKQLPSRFFGALIAAYCDEIVERPNKVEAHEQRKT